ncbi:MAG: CCA tRNA nucleotidyltransferase [Patescibacteria group bacterium]|nr:CCA tRNA nucleotidyltransferase [Patescibacteria group bacterium]
MKTAQNSLIPAEVATIAETLEKAGFQAYLVGGCVRDMLIGRKPKDWDLTTNALPQDIQGLFLKTVYENSFGTVAVINENPSDETLRSVEITPYRMESGYSDQRHPDSISFSDKIEDDLKRRDFTINAIAAGVSKDAIKDIVDLFGGISDIKDKIIRTVGDPVDRFTEDALRMVRAIRLSVEIGFTINIDTYKAINKLNSSIKTVSAERIRDEFTRILMSDEPMKGLLMLHETGLLKHMIPELERGIGVIQPQAHAYDVWEHLLRSLQHAADKEYPLDIRLAALFHDISKPETKGFSQETHQPTFYGHELKGSRETRRILERLRFSRATIDKVVKLVRWHMFFADTETITLTAVRRMIVNVGKDNIWDLMNLRICDRIGTGRPKENPYRLRKYRAMIEEALRDPISVSMLKIDGAGVMKSCNIEPGPKIGHILHALFAEVINDPKLNTLEYLEKRAIELSKIPDNKLMILGEEGRNIKDSEEEKDVAKIRRKYYVS